MYYVYDKIKQNDKNYYDYEPNYIAKKCEHCKKDNDENLTIIKCGNINSSVVIPAGTTSASNFTLASLNINLNKLCDPVIKLEFTSNFLIGAFVGTISVQVFKQCSNFQPVAVGSSFLFTLPAPGITAANPFTFFVCDNDFCIDKCCNYTVVATPVGTTAGTLTINNATLGAIATNHYNNCH